MPDFGEAKPVKGIHTFHEAGAVGGAVNPSIGDWGETPEAWQFSVITAPQMP